MDHFLKTTKEKLKKIYDDYFKDFWVKTLAHLLKLLICLLLKMQFPKSWSRFETFIYKFTCADSNTCYIGETARHLSTRIEEQFKKDKNSHIFKYLNKNHNCKKLGIPDGFQIIASASLKFRLKLKKTVHITWNKSLLNRQLSHVTISITV